METKRKICVITGSRAEYGLLKPVIKEIKNSKELKLCLVVVGMHLEKEFGNTIEEIQKHGFKIDGSVRMTAEKDSKKAMAQSIGQGIIGITDLLDKIRPDIVLVLGDRTEALAAAISAVYTNTILAHIHGGDTPQAGLDEYSRHAITKMAHIHFPATKKSAERIIKMGENPKNVHIVGAPGLDSILKEDLSSAEDIADKHKLDLNQPILLVLQHSNTTDIENAGNQIKQTMEAVKELGYQSVVIYPNADAGGRKMIKVIKKYRECPFLQIHKNLNHKDYLGLMKIADVMLGNSSSGIIEAPSFKLLVVNIGTRQKGRERADNIIDVDYDKNQIKKAIQKALKNKLKECQSPYGNGTASKKIVGVLRKIKIDKKLLAKKLIY